MRVDIMMTSHKTIKAKL